jgi:hypothetical protein
MEFSVFVFGIRIEPGIFGIADFFEAGVRIGKRKKDGRYRGIGPLGAEQKIIRELTGRINEAVRFEQRPLGQREWREGAGSRGRAWTKLWERRNGQSLK